MFPHHFIMEQKALNYFQGKGSHSSLWIPSIFSLLLSRAQNTLLQVLFGFPGSSEGKESSCNARDLSLIPGLGRSPGEGNGNPLQNSCLENSHGQRSLAGYSPWGHKELDTAERLTHTYIQVICFRFLSPWLHRELFTTGSPFHSPLELSGYSENGK